MAPSSAGAATRVPRRNWVRQRITDRYGINMAYRSKVCIGVNERAVMAGAMCLGTEKTNLCFLH